ncbi:MAG: hypothetical protein JXR96_08625 [Deltaproteobacteria bacterium]|nr:hypothetical protein [Deltaproteobacteria bacterium]
MRAKALIPVALMLAAWQAQAGEKVDLRFKFSPGEKIVYQMVMEQSMEAETELAPGMIQKVLIKMDMDMYQKTVAADDAGAGLEVGYTRVDATMGVGGQPMPVPGADELTRVKLTMRMTPRGRISDAKIAGADKVGEKARKMAEEMKKSLAQGTMIFPDKAIEVGETWSHKQKLPANIEGAKNLMMDVESQYKLVGMEKHRGKPCAKIQATVKLSLHGKAVQNNIPLQADLEGQGSSVNLFSPELGRSLQTRTRMDIGGTVTATAQGRDIKTSLKIGTTAQMDVK